MKVMSIALIVVLGSFAASTLTGQGGGSQSVIQRGIAISPVPVNLAGKNPALVAEGSYIVNTGGCNDCHTSPEFVPGGNPFLGEPEQINAAAYLAGGRAFGPFVSRNLTPDKNGNPGGLTFAQFVQTMRTGIDLKAIPPANILQVMPWPVVAKHTDSNMKAIYEYLRAIPCLEGGPGNPTPPATRCQ